MKPRFLPLVCLLLGACSSVSVIEEQENAALAPKAVPTALLVRPFEVSRGARFDVAPASEKDDPRDKVGRLIAEGALSRGARWVAPTKVLERGAKPPQTGLLVEGCVLVAQQGSRALQGTHRTCCFGCDRHGPGVPLPPPLPPQYVPLAM